MMNVSLFKLQRRFPTRQKLLEKGIRIYLTVGQSNFTSNLATAIIGQNSGGSLAKLRSAGAVVLIEKRGATKSNNVDSPGYWRFSDAWVNYMRTPDGQEVCDAAGIC